MKRIFAILMLLWAVPAWADTHAAATCESAAVQTAVNSAVDGDTVTIPSGTCTWTTPGSSAAVTITKAITLQGAGCAVDANGRAVDPCGTVINDQTAIDFNVVLILVDYGGTSTVRITGLKIVLDTDAGNYGGEVKITGGTNAFRIDHCVFNAGAHIHANGIDIRGVTYGVVDHNSFLSSQDNMWKALQMTVDQAGDYWVTSSPSPASFGTANAVYMEDNTFTEAQTDAAPYRIVDIGPGGRFVFRYNITNNSGDVGGHGWDTDPAAPVSVEMYNNTINWTVSANFWLAVSFRGGTGVIFNNTLNATAGGWDAFIKLFYYCACSAMVGPNLDCNTNIGHSLQTYAGHEQPGFGPNGSGGQVSAPIYEWNNTTTITPHIQPAGSCANEVSMIQANRDYFINTAMPGYTPYQYPHPLQGLTGTLPAAPTNVRIR